MNYISTIETAKKWNISQRRVIKLASEGRIKGAYRFGNSWMIPDTAEKPQDGRIKKAKTTPDNDTFRFPLYVNFSENSFSPPLSEDEQLLRQAELCLLACDFENAKDILKKLGKTTKNIYIKIAVYFFKCIISTDWENGVGFELYHKRMQLAMVEDFPHKKDMEFVYPWLYSCLALYKNASDAFNIESDYCYSPSVYPLMSVLSFYRQSNDDMDSIKNMHFDIYEVECRQLEMQGCFYEAQKLHIILFVLYYLQLNEKLIMHHLKKALEIAFKFNFIFPVADAAPYYTDIYKKALRDYPEDFAEKIQKCGNQIHKSYSAFTKNKNITKIYHSLSGKDFQFILLASQGYTYKHVAKVMHLAERTVANYYAKIYEKLSISGKKELIELMSDVIIPNR